MSIRLPKISIIITTYNSQLTIERLINSILNQEGKDDDFTMELIIIDDCSNDKTVPILKAYNLDFSSTSVNTGGPNTGRNMGLKRASGDFICIADHDDEWNPKKIKTLLPYLNLVPIVTSGFTLLDVKTQRKTEIVKHSKNSETYLMFEKNETFLKKLTRNKNSQNTYLGSIVFSKDLKHIKFEEKYGMVDSDWLIKLFYQQTSIEVLHSLYIRHVEGNNLSLNENYRINDYLHSIEFVKTYSSDYPSEVKKAIGRINGTMARYYYSIGRMKEARKYFSSANFSVKTIIYYFTSFFGSTLIKKYFRVFG